MEPFPAGVYDPWGLQEEIRLLKVAQFEHTERLSQHSERINKLEKRHDDSRIRSLWSTSSPFPAPLSTFSQQPINPEPGSCNGYEQQHQNLVLSGLQLDDVDVPRRGASRANSVRFDDSATTNHWIHNSPGTSDYFGSRSTNIVGGYAMTDRSSSHKSDNRSDGRQSLRSFGGDVSSSYEGENIVFQPPPQSSDILDSCLHRSSARRLGPAPAMIRCWIDTQPNPDSLLYAIICTGSARSAIEMSLVLQLRLQHRITRKSEGAESKIELPVMLVDATQQQQHSRLTPPPKPPRLAVEFVVLPISQPESKEHSEIRIFLGSDVISSHMGDVLFSQSRIVLTVNDGRKVSVPFIRPEGEDAFSDILTVHSGDYIPKNSAVHEHGGAIEKLDVPIDKSGMTVGDDTRSHISVSSPRPIRGGQASVIRGVTSMELSGFPLNAQVQPSPTNTERGGGDTHQGNDASRPWTALGEAKEGSFRVPSSSGGSPGTADPNSLFDNKGDADGMMTRGRSLTNPFEDSPSTMPKARGKTWEGARKPSMSYSAPLKETGGGIEPYSRGSSRGMKVLRTSKSFSSSEKANQSNLQGGSGAESSTSTGPTKRASFVGAKPGGDRGHNRTMSGGDAIHPSPNSKGSLVRTKSSNVVGGATAFHWMAPKAVSGAE